MKQILIVLFTSVAFISFAQTPVVYDIVLQGGRVIDPETKLDASRNVGIIKTALHRSAVSLYKAKR